MSSPPVPRWLVIVGSVAISGHLLAVLVNVLSTTSGPWPSPFGSSPADPPMFASVLSRRVMPYLGALKMTHTYHFSSNIPATPGIRLEARLKDDRGQLLMTIRVPDEQANLRVRHRQALLARGLGDDAPVAPPQGEAVAAPGQQLQTVPVWDGGPDRILRIRELPEHLLPRDRPLMRPNEWALLLSRSYARYLCRTHGAASAEIVRIHQDPIYPTVLFLGEPPTGALEPYQSIFGELSK